MMKKKRVPRPTVSITVKVPLDQAERLYDLVNLEFSGNISAAVREAIDDLVEKFEKRR